MEDSSNNSFNYASQDGAEIASTPVDPRASLARRLAIIFVAISVVLSGITSASLLGSNVDDYSYADDFGTDYYDDSATDDLGWDSSWVPIEFTAWTDDSNIAWRWADDHDCSDYSCVTAEFISEYGCPSGLYVAVNWLDEYDNVVSYTNESLPSLLAMQTAKLRFDDYEEIGDSGQIAEISCN
jgi:hypothetical protein